MKTSSRVNCRLGLTLVIAIGFASTGCRSSTWKMPSWKMPGSKFFANREPDAETLAGKGSVPSLPESPAAKYTSSNIAAMGKSTATTGSNSSIAGTSSSGSTYGYSNPTTTPQTGLAAQGNGFQVGQYQLGNTAGVTTGTTGPTGTAGTTGSLASGANSLPNAYGGSYTGSPSGSKSALNSAYGSAYGGATTPGQMSSNLPSIPGDIPLPNSVSQAIAAGSGQPSNYPVAQGSYSMPNIPAISYTAKASSTGPALPNSSDLPTPPASSYALPTLPPPSDFGSFDPKASAGGTYMLANPAAASTPTGGTQTPATSAYQNAQTTGFAPGSAGRSTTYDFSGSKSDSQSGSNTLVPPNTSLPPNTATLPNQPPRY